MGQKILVEAAGGSKYRARRGCKRARQACSGAAETNFSSGNSPHPKGLNASQPLFASYLNVSPNAVRSWERGTCRPRQAAPKLLTIARKNPKACSHISCHLKLQ